MKIITIVGARPQFIKAATISRYIMRHSHLNIDEKIIHTGQHYDKNMSEDFFDELGIPNPTYHLNIAGGKHGDMTGRMLCEIEKVLSDNQPNMVLIYGDTNSTLAGALAAAKLHIPVAHIEAGLRSFDMRMPEEINRCLSDKISSLLFCPTQTAVQNLRNEGIEKGVFFTGDVMYDSCLFYQQQKNQRRRILDELNIEEKNYFLVTCHRESNTNSRKYLNEILSGLQLLSSEKQVVFTLHPRTKKQIAYFGLEEQLKGISVIPPMPYIDMLTLTQFASKLITDSGGLQKEAFFLKVPCVTMRENTEWTETVDSGWNKLVGASKKRIVDAAMSSFKMLEETNVYGDGNSAETICKIISDHF